MSDQSPWLSVWCNPKATIRKIVAENPRKSLWVLAFIYGLSSVIHSFPPISLGQMTGMFPLLIAALIISPFWGYALFSLWSWVVCKVGKWLKGEGDFIHVRAAFAWASVPLVLNIALGLLMICVLGSPFLSHVQEGYPMSNQQTSFLFLILIGKVVIAIWSLVLYLNMLAEVQKFSILRAIFNLLLAWVVIVLVLWLIWFGLMYVMQMGSDSSKVTFEFWSSKAGVPEIVQEYLRSIL